MKFTVDFLMKKDCFVQTYTLLTVFQLNRQTVILTKITLSHLRKIANFLILKVKLTLMLKTHYILTVRNYSSFNQETRSLHDKLYQDVQFLNLTLQINYSQSEMALSGYQQELCETRMVISLFESRNSVSVPPWNMT